MDIGLDEDFDITLDDRNDLPTVEGREAFEQRLAIRVTAYYHRIVGSVNRSNMASLLRMQANRVAQDAPDVNRVVDIRVGFSDEQANTAEVTAIYETGDEFAFSLTE